MTFKSLLPKFHNSEPHSLAIPYDFSLDGLRKEMDRTFERFFNTGMGNDLETSFMQPVNIAEDEKGYELKVEVPGMSREDIHLEIVDNRLIISGEKKDEKEVKEKNFHRTESTYGKFQRSFLLDEGCDPDHIEAVMKNGILTINIHKLPVEKQNRKKVPISN